MRLLIVILVTLWQSNVMENPPLTSYQPPFLVDFPIFSYDFVQLETSIYTWFSNIYIYISGWWFQPLWKILKSVGMIIPNIWKTKKCSKTPTRYVYRHTNSPAQRGTPTHESGGIWGHLQHGQIDITWRWNAVVTAMGCWTTKNRPVIYLGYSAKRYENMSCRYTSNVDMMGISWEYSGLIEST